MFVFIAVLFGTVPVNAQTAEDHYNQAIVKEHQGDWKGALVGLNQAIALNPKYTDAYFERANVKSSFGDHEGSFEDRKQAEMQCMYVNILSQVGIFLTISMIIIGFIVGFITMFKPLKHEINSKLKTTYNLYAIIQLALLLIYFLSKVINPLKWGIAWGIYWLFILASLVIGIGLLIVIPKTTLRERVLLSLTFSIPIVITLLSMADGGF